MTKCNFRAIFLLKKVTWPVTWYELCTLLCMHCWLVMFNCRFTAPSAEKHGKKTGIIDQPRFSCQQSKYVIKKSPYLVTDPTFQLYELSGLLQEMSKSNNPLSNFFCGMGWTKWSFFSPGAPTITENSRNNCSLGFLFNVVLKTTILHGDDDYDRLRKGKWRQD